jgi:hypothetical protein
MSCRAGECDLQNGQAISILSSDNFFIIQVFRPSMANFWTRELKAQFHCAIEALYGKTQNPFEEVNYRAQGSRPDTSQYILRFEHELQLVDHLAFLAQTREGVKEISAACVQETDDGLIVFLATNEGVASKTLLGLRALFDVLRMEAKKGTVFSAPLLPWAFMKHVLI